MHIPISQSCESDIADIVTAKSYSLQKIIDENFPVYFQFEIGVFPSNFSHCRILSNKKKSFNILSLNKPQFGCQ